MCNLVTKDLEIQASHYSLFLLPNDLTPTASTSSRRLRGRQRVDSGPNLIQVCFLHFIEKLTN